MRHRLLALTLAALAVLAFASVAVAGGWALVTAENPPVDPPAGEETTIQLTMLQHGKTPVSWPGLTVIATDANTGAVVRAEAVAKGPEGSYVATFVFPTAGAWNLTFESNDLFMEGSVAMNIAPAVAAATPAATSAASAIDVLPIVLVLLAGVAALLIAGQILRSREVSRDPRVSAGT